MLQITLLGVEDLLPTFPNAAAINQNTDIYRLKWVYQWTKLDFNNPLPPELSGNVT